MATTRRWTDADVQYLREAYPRTPISELTDELDRTTRSIRAKAHKIGVERHEDAEIITRLVDRDRPSFRDDAFANFIAGFVAGEGSFHITEQDQSRPRFAFSIALTGADVMILEEIREFLGVGHLGVYDRDDPTYKAEAIYTVQSVVDHAIVTVPFFDEYGLQSTLKQAQYDEWRAALFDQYDVESYVP